MCNDIGIEKADCGCVTNDNYYARLVHGDVRSAKYQRLGTQYYHHYSGCCDLICESNAV